MGASEYVYFVRSSEFEGGLPVHAFYRRYDLVAWVRDHDPYACAYEYWRVHWYRSPVNITQDIVKELTP